jgi:hypothetical protein
MEKHEGKIYYDKYCRIFSKGDEEIDMILDIGEKNFELFVKYNKYLSREKISISNLIEYEEKIKKLENVIEEANKEYKMELDIEKNKLNKLREELLQEVETEKVKTNMWRDQYNKIVTEQKKAITEAIEDREKYFNELRKITEDKNKLQLSNLENKLNSELIYLKHEKDKEETKRKEVENELEKLRQEYGITKEKSELRGSDFENYFYKQLEKEVQMTGIWKLKKCTQEKGKGDLLLVNNYTGYRVMIELKHMKSVPATNENQQPKFIRDLTSKENNYDAGIMIASGEIVGKSHYQTDIIQGKIAYYISNYKMDDIKLFMVSLKFIFDMIKNHKSTEFFKFEDMKRELLSRYKVFYETASRMRTLYETFEKNKKELGQFIWKTYEIDADEHMKKTIHHEKQTIAKKDKHMREEEIIQQIKNELDKIMENPEKFYSKSQIIKFSGEFAKNEIMNKEITKKRISEFAKEYYHETREKKIKQINKNRNVNIKIET